MKGDALKDVLKRRRQPRIAALIACIASVIALSLIFIYVQNTFWLFRDAGSDAYVSSQVTSYDDGEIDPNLLRRIDFDELRAINGDVATWLSVPGSAIDSYVMQESSPSSYYYLNHDIYKDRRVAGSYFIPAEPKGVSKDLDAHTLILGHRMQAAHGEWMFSNLPNRFSSLDAWAANPYVYTYDDERSYRWRVWTGYSTTTNDEIYTLPQTFGSDSYAAVLSDVAARVSWSSCMAPDSYTPTLVLSTCNTRLGNQGRFVCVCVPDVSYCYETGEISDFASEHSLETWYRDTADYEANLPRYVDKI